MAIPERTKDKVAIVGFAPSKVEAPLKDPSWEKWGINELYAEFGFDCWDRYFDLHKDRFTRQKNNERADNHAGNLAKLKCPVYLVEPREDIPNSVAFPKDEVMAQTTGYMTNTISWLTGLAICMGFETIAIFGVDMATGTEYTAQRPSCEYLIGLARGRGINVYVPKTSDLLKNTFLYGFEDDHPFRTKLQGRIKELQQRRVQFANQLEQAKAAVNQVDGALEDSKYILGVWGQ